MNKDGRKETSLCSDREDTGVFVRVSYGHGLSICKGQVTCD